MQGRRPVFRGFTFKVLENDFRLLGGQRNNPAKPKERGQKDAARTHVAECRSSNAVLCD